MKGSNKLLWTLFIAALFMRHTAQGQRNDKDVQLFTDNLFYLSEVMLHDVASPVAASRFYAYAMLGAYEASYLGMAKLPDIKGRLKVDPAIKIDHVPDKLSVPFCAIYTMLDVGRQIMPSGYLLEAKQKELVSLFKKRKRLPQNSLDEQVSLAKEIASQVVRYARADGYNKLSTFKRYTPNKAEGHWYPTPPEYMSAVEPHWKTIRPFFLDSAAQFAPPAPAAFSKDTASPFYKQMKEVYDVSKSLTEEQRTVAAFWDCNPFAVTYSGHMAIGLKKISPGGHWMSITGIASRKANISLDSAILVHTVVALTLQDAFISCWTEKYSSDRIRPESAINKFLDPSWRPLLQTPPFPEYTSGHSVASSSVAVILTHFFGDNFTYDDASEVYFGIPERRFTSFYEAANEAAVSRLYGGIHFRDACENGIVQGKRIGCFILARLFDVHVAEIQQ